MALFSMTLGDPVTTQNHPIFYILQRIWYFRNGYIWYFLSRPRMTYTVSSGTLNPTQLLNYNGWR